MSRFLQQFPGEGYLWSAAMLYLAFLSPLAQIHFTLCPIALTGLEFCPGCGLGHVISALLRGHVMQSLQCHPLGPFATAILTGRIIILALHAIKDRTLHCKTEQHAQHCQTSP